MTSPSASKLWKGGRQSEKNVMMVMMMMMISVV